jgi:hypothetical protein
MPPYVIKQGDHLLLLAHKLGFDADTVWNDPSNAPLRQLRSDPNILLPGDVLQLPDSSGQSAPPASLNAGTANNFVSDAPTMTLSVKFVGADATTYASRAYTVQELTQLTDLTTDENGVASFQAPVTLGSATLVFTESGESWVLCPGAMDPINTLSGIFKRLQNLGYIAGDVQFDGQTPLNNVAVLRPALVALKAAQSGPPPSAPASAPASAPSSSPPSAPSSTAASGPSSSPAPASTPPQSTPASGPAPASAPASGAAPESAPASAPPSAPSMQYFYPPDSSPPSSSPPSDAAPPSSSNGGSGSSADPSGLGDDGTLDAETTQLLLTAHGS